VLDGDRGDVLFSLGAQQLVSGIQNLDSFADHFQIRRAHDQHGAWYNLDEEAVHQLAKVCGHYRNPWCHLCDHQRQSQYPKVIAILIFHPAEQVAGC
jgi:hypothetical protein